MASTLFIVFFFQCLIGSHSTTFKTVNKCNYTVWPGIQSGAGTSPLSPTGFALHSGESRAVAVPVCWSGRLWGRTLCTQDATTGKFSCVTGDCGSSTIECSGGGAAPPATLAEFTLNGAGGLDFFQVSLVHGYNLPMMVEPQGGTGAGNCSTTGCLVDLNAACPTELKVMTSSGGDGESVACKSACEAFGDPRHCFRGAYASPDTCKPSSYSQFFKSACPRACTYSHDQAKFTCASADYLVTFCPSTNGMKLLPRNVKDSMAVDNSGGHADGWSVNKFIVFAVTLASAFVFLGCKLTGCGRRLVCNIELEPVTSSETSIPEPATV